ncbi:MAG: HEPN domain-containing protein, partial [Candidatus Bathyarchaeia archaeon]
MDLGVCLERFEKAKRWPLQALRDLKAARDSVGAGNHEWASFQAQQSAERAVKALLNGL